MFECDPALQDYDVDRMNSAVQDWKILGRWEYDPKRGLRLDTRKPQLPDTELKELGYGEADTGFEVSSSEASTRPAGRRQSNPPKTYATEIDVKEVSAKAGAKRKNNATKASRPKRRKTKQPVHDVDSSSTDDISEDETDPIPRKDSTDSKADKNEQKMNDQKPEASAEYIQEILRLREELVALKKEQPPPPPPPLPPPPPPEINGPPSLPFVPPDHPCFNKEMTTVRTERTHHVEISSRSFDLDRFAIQSLQRQARMQADLDIAENEATTQYRIRRRAEAFNAELQMELILALRSGSSR